MNFPISEWLPEEIKYKPIYSPPLPIDGLCYFPLASTASVPLESHVFLTVRVAQLNHISPFSPSVPLGNDSFFSLCSWNGHIVYIVCYLSFPMLPSSYFASLYLSFLANSRLDPWVSIFRVVIDGAPPRTSSVLSLIWGQAPKPPDARFARICQGRLHKV